MFKTPTKNQNELMKGDAIIVKDGTMDPDYNYDISGYTGIISEIDDETNLVTIEWGSKTLRKIPEHIFRESEKDGLDWSSMNLYKTEISLSNKNESIEEKKRVCDETSSKVWLYGLGDQGVRILNVLQYVKDMTNDIECFKAWAKFLKKHLIFPFDANVDEFALAPIAQKSNTVKILSLYNYSEDEAIAGFGLYVNVKSDMEKLLIPLSDIEVKDKRSRFCEMINDYTTWFDNSR